MLTKLAFLDLGGPLAVIIIVLAIGILIFEICMIVSAITNKHISDTARILWVLGMLIIHPFVALIYYFTDHQKRDSQNNSGQGL